MFRKELCQKLYDDYADASEWANNNFLAVKQMIRDKISLSQTEILLPDLNPPEFFYISVLAEKLQEHGVYAIPYSEIKESLFDKIPHVTNKWLYINIAMQKVDTTGKDWVLLDSTALINEIVKTRL